MTPITRFNCRRRRVLGTVSALLAGVAIAPRALRAMAPERTGNVLRARLMEHGVGLVAVQVDAAAGRIELVARGEARAGVALRDDARFEIGSLTKTFTALLLADLVLAKQIALDGAVEDALADTKLRDAAGEPIRWVDLATHRSGLPRLPGNAVATDPLDPYAGYDDVQLLAFLRAFRPSVARDTRWIYSNLGYGVLGHALGRVAKVGFEEALAARVLRPLGLASATLATPGKTIAELAQGHDDARRPVSHWHFQPAMAGAGALVMNGDEVGRYLRAALVRDASPLGDAFALAQREHAAGPSPVNPTGLAWLRASLDGRPILTHDGGTNGFASSTWLDPQRGKGVALLANARVEISDLALHLLEEKIPPKDLASTRQPEILLPAEQVLPLAGVYALSPALKLELTVRAGQLWAQAAGQPPFQLFAAAQRRFFARVTPLEIEFDAATPPAAFTLRQGGASARFFRE